MLGRSYGDEPRRIGHFDRNHFMNERRVQEVMLIVLFPGTARPGCSG